MGVRLSETGVEPVVVSLRERPEPQQAVWDTERAPVMWFRWAVNVAGRVVDGVARSEAGARAAADAMRGRLS